MADFLLIWSACLVTLLVSLGALYWTYRLLGSDFGLNSWKAELITAAWTAALQACVYAVALYLTREGAGTIGATRFAVIFSVAILCVCFKLTHLTDLGGLELAILAGVQHLLVIAVAFARS